jgi:hypothetical protein
VDRIRVSSTNVASIGYEAETETLEVEFANGSIYQYSRVPQHRWDGLLNASSKGTYLNNHIRKGPYTCRRIR